MCECLRTVCAAEEMTSGDVTRSYTATSNSTLVQNRLSERSTNECMVLSLRKDSQDATRSTHLFYETIHKINMILASE